MSDENTKVEHAEEITNRSTADERKILSRLILQRIMSDDSVKFMSKDSYDKVSKLMLSESPDDAFNLTYKYLDARHDSYYSNIVTLSLRWEQSNTEINDVEGNVWTAYSFIVTPALGGGYGVANNCEKLGQIATCTSQVHALITEVKGMVPDAIRVMILDNDGRIARDEQRKYDGVCSVLEDRIRFSHRPLRTGLRRGGRARVVSRDDAFLKDIVPGTYNFTVNDGTSRRPNNTHYVVYVPEVAHRFATIKRVV